MELCPLEQATRKRVAQSHSGLQSEENLISDGDLEEDIVQEKSDKWTDKQCVYTRYLRIRVNERAQEVGAKDITDLKNNTCK